MGHAGSEHSFGMVSQQQEHLNTTRDHSALFNQPCLISTRLPFGVYFQTSLPSTLGFAVNARSEAGAAAVLHWEEAVKHLLLESLSGQMGVLGALITTPDGAPRSPGHSCWQLWHPRPRLHLGFKINKPVALRVCRLMIMVTQLDTKKG